MEDLRHNEILEDLLVHDEVEQAAEEQFFSDHFFLQRRRLNNLFGEDYVTANPILIAAAVMEDEMKALRLEMTQLQIAIDNLQK